MPVGGGLTDVGDVPVVSIVRAGPILWRECCFSRHLATRSTCGRNPLARQDLRQWHGSCSATAVPQCVQDLHTFRARTANEQRLHSERAPPDGLDGLDGLKVRDTAATCGRTRLAAFTIPMINASRTVSAGGTIPLERVVTLSTPVQTPDPVALQGREVEPTRRWGGLSDRWRCAGRTWNHLLEGCTTR